MGTTSKLALGLGTLTLFIVLLLWLGGVTPTRLDRRQAINAALQNGTIGGLTQNETDSLVKTVRWLAAAAGVKARVVLNEPFPAHEDSPTRPVLRFFTTTPVMKRLTYCASSNAVYDGTLDAVFIDNELVHSRRWLVHFRDISWISDFNEQDLAEALSFLHVYLRFIILHELGHREKHYGVSGAADAGYAAPESSVRALLTSKLTARERETEADNFAWASMPKAYEQAAAAGITISADETNNFTSTEGTASQEQRAQLALVHASLQMGFARALGFTPLSVYYSDLAHPTFPVRTQNLIHLLLNRSHLNAEVRSYAEVVQATMRTMDSLPFRAETEIITNRPVYTAAFGSDRLLLMPAQDDSITTLPYQALLPPRASKLWWNRPQRAPRVLSAATGPRAPSAGPDPKAGFSVIGTPKNSFLRVEAPGQTYTLTPAWQWHRGPLPPLARSTRYRDYEINHLPQPVSRILIQGMWDEVLLPDGSVVQRRKSQELIAEAQVLLSRQGHAVAITCDLREATMDLPHIYAVAWQDSTDGRRPYGLVTIEANTLRVLAVQPFQAGSGDGALAYLPNKRATVVPVPMGNRTVRCVLVRTVSVDGHAVKDQAPVTAWEAWELSGSHPPRRIIRRNLLLGQVSPRAQSTRGVQELITGELQRAWYVPPHYVLLNFEADAVFLFDLLQERACPVAYPGYEDMKVAVHQDGGILLWFESGYRLLFIDSQQVWQTDGPAGWVGWLAGGVLGLVLLFLLVHFSGQLKSLL